MDSGIWEGKDGKTIQAVAAIAQDRRPVVAWITVGGEAMAWSGVSFWGWIRKSLRERGSPGLIFRVGDQQLGKQGCQPAGVKMRKCWWEWTCPWISRAIFRLGTQMWVRVATCATPGPRNTRASCGFCVLFVSEQVALHICLLHWSLQSRWQLVTDDLHMEMKA